MITDKYCKVKKNTKIKILLFGLVVIEFYMSCECEIINVKLKTHHNTKTEVKKWNMEKFKQHVCMWL